MFLFSRFLGGIFLVFLFLGSTSADLVINEHSFHVDPKIPVINKKATVYLTVQNSSNRDMRGVVRVFDVTEGKKVEIEQTFTALAQKTGDVFFVFTPQVPGNHEMTVKIIPWEDYAENNFANDKISTTIWVDSDFDADGIGDSIDPDDDNDKIKDEADAFPKNAKEQKDTDGDKKGDNEDDDDDNDGILDTEDVFPFDAKEKNDADGDKKGDNEDDDDDNDGLHDEAEKMRGTDPLKPDTDGDGVNDGEDDFPLDASRQYDTDKDGIPNADDDDDDGDGIGDNDDLFPLDANESKDSDGDGVGDFSDPDDDNDGLLDEDEHRAGSDPFNKDSDGDGVEDGSDAMPTDANETKDSDLDGLGDNADPNDTNKGPVVKIADFSKKIFRGKMLEISAIESFDPEGGTLSFIWEILNEHENVKLSQSGSRFQAVFHGIGTQKIRLTVRDGNDEVRTQNFEIEIVPTTLDVVFSVLFTLFFLLAIFGAYKYFHSAHHRMKKQK